MKSNKLFLVLFINFLIISCGFLQEKIPNQTNDLPKTYSLYSDLPKYNNEWWKEFNNDELNNFINMAINDNFNILEAWARLEQAQAEAKKSGSYLYPEISANGGGTKNITKKEGHNTLTIDGLSLGLSVSYELDLWGRVRASKKSAYYQLKATREDVNTAIMTITSQIAEIWVEIISLNKKIQTFEEQLKINREILKILEVRLANSMSDFLAVYQQKQSIATIESALIPLYSKKKLLEHQLALLLGKPANYRIDIKTKDFPKISEIPRTGIPADLLSMRPDVRAAGLRLKAANQAIVAAKANRLPAIRLTASHTYSSDTASEIFNNWIQNLAVNLIAPLFDAGRRKAEVERTQAVLNERLSNYKRTVITAIKEVEDALVSEKFNRKTLNAKINQLKISQKTFKEAGSRYLNGLIDYLPVLREQLNIANYKEKIIQAEADILKSRIQLQKALGGAWFDKIKQPDLNKKRNK